MLRTAGIHQLLEVFTAALHGSQVLLASMRVAVLGDSWALKGAPAMRDVLAPLHRPSGRIDEVVPCLTLYHEPLVHCCVALLSKQPSLLMTLLPALLSMLRAVPRVCFGSFAAPSSISDAVGGTGGRVRV